VLTAVARLRRRLRVLVNSGGLHPPGRPNRLFALYDGILRSVALGDSAFHPKVWVLSFEPLSRPDMKGAERIYRVLCASRNVTDSGCWELGARFDGTRGQGSELGRDLAQFCRRLAKHSQMPPDVHRLIAVLPQVEFDGGSAGSEGLRLHFQWPGESQLAPRLPKRPTRVLYISPFVRSDLVTKLAERTSELTLVSTQVELDALPEAAHVKLASAAKYVVTGAGSGDVPALELHAKALLWEDGSSRETLMGSANATGAAWGLSGRTNCEAMLALRPGLSIDAVLRSFVSPRKGELHPWIEEYRRELKEPDEEELAGRRLDALTRDLSQLKVRGHHDPDEASLALSAIGPKPTALTPLPDGVRAELAPLLRSDDAASWRPLLSLFDGGARFGDVARADLCAFVVVRLTDSRADKPRIFCLQFDLRISEEESAARDEAVHSHLLASYDPRALLLNVLKGLPAGQGAAGTRSPTPGEKGPSRGLLDLASFERVMEACTADSSRVDEVDALLSACRHADGMASFVEFWNEFKAVLAAEIPRG
jgi:hypothetical protein